MTKRNLTLGGEHTMKYTYDELLNCTLESYIILSINVAPINLIFKKDDKNKHQKLRVAATNAF